MDHSETDRSLLWHHWIRLFARGSSYLQISTWRRSIEYVIDKKTVIRALRKKMGKWGSGAVPKKLPDYSDFF